jgi:hypothetical protein
MKTENQNLTHWKRFRNPDYFGAYAMPTDGSEIVLTIKSAGQEIVKGTDGKKKDCLVIHFQENVKPMILNSTNSKSISKVAKSNYIEKWTGVKIQIYVAKINAFGEDTECLRIRQTAPQVNTIKPIITQDDIDSAYLMISGCETLDELKNVWKMISKEIQSNPEIISLKDELKNNLQ